MTSETVKSPVLAAEPKRCRSFAVSDAMFLIAGAAFAISNGSSLFVNLAEQGIGLCRTIATHDSAFYIARPQFWRTAVAIHWSNVLWYGFQVVDVLVLGLTPAFLLVRLRRPRPSIRA